MVLTWNKQMAYLICFKVDFVFDFVSECRQMGFWELNCGVYPKVLNVVYHDMELIWLGNFAYTVSYM